MHDWTQTIIILISFAGGFAFLLRYIKSENRDLKKEIDRVRVEMRAEINGIRQELNSIATCLGRIEGSLHPFYFPGSISNPHRENDNKKRKAQ